jgi:hypothetical protein
VDLDSHVECSHEPCEYTLLVGLFLWWRGYEEYQGAASVRSFCCPILPGLSYGVSELLYASFDLNVISGI